MKKFYFLFFLTIGFLANAQILNIPDANFKAKLLSASASNTVAKDLAGVYFKIDSNNDGEIQVNEAEFVSYLNITCLSCSSNAQRISNLAGLNSFINLRFFITYDNYLINYDLEIINNNTIVELDLRDNFKSIIIQNTNNLSLLRFSDSYNPNGSILIENAPSLTTNFSEVFLIPISITGNFKIKNCSSIQKLQFTRNTDGVVINNVIIENLPNLNHIYLKGSQTGSNSTFPYSINNFTLIDTPLLNYLNIEKTNITNLDLYHYSSNISTFTSTDNKNLNRIQAVGLPLVDFNLWGNHNNLDLICVDDENFEIVKLEVLQNTLNTRVTPYCSFVPNGEYYSIQGNSKIDSNNNGCDVSDINYSNLRFNITNGTISGSMISNQTGSYHIPVQAGIHTITPNLENPTYFNILPISFTVNFPTQVSPFTQDFCVTANGIKHDVEVVLIPTVPARPGFDANYKLIYRNKGNQIESGSISLTFDDAKLDFVSSSPVYNSTTVNNSTWNYTNLEPFETREIALVLNVNSPMEIPAVNIGDQINFLAEITPFTNDEVQYDNIFALKQIVVGSYDPNDKTCLEGTTITPSEVGKYVHYVIRFENTGTFPAENIVVKDMIDLAKFDLATLIPLKGSHDFYTRINGNKVEFIFEDINLDFNDATNDGYVAFKIKTLPSLVLGDTFTNDANIYFDYNFPITTNTYTTTVAALSTQDFDFGTHFALYPNPANDILNIQTKQGLGVNSIEIYNQLGQIVMATMATTNAVNTVDVSNLASGTYFVKINTEKGSANAKFVKE